MRYDPVRHHRSSVRLPQFDYGASGAYFITVCAAQHRPVFGRIIQCELQLNAYGRIVDEEWRRSFEVRPDIALDEYIVMPNHFHAIVWIGNRGDDGADAKTDVGACGGTPSCDARSNLTKKILHFETNRKLPDLGVPPHAPTLRAPSKTLGALVNGFKGSVTRRINQHRCQHGLSPVIVWQRSFHDRIIRDEKELLVKRRYIIENPLHWERDEYFPTSNS